MRWLFPGKEVTVRSRCLDCGEPILIRTRDESVIDLDPPTAVAYMTSPFSKWREGSAPFN